MLLKLKTESANIKRGLINVLTSSTIPMQRISRRSLAALLLQTAPHNELKYLKKANIASSSDDKDAKINRTFNTKVTKSKNGSDAPKILIESTEQLRLSSVFFSRLFDVVADSLCTKRNTRQGLYCTRRTLVIETLQPFK